MDNKEFPLNQIVLKTMSKPSLLRCFSLKAGGGGVYLTGEHKRRMTDFGKTWFQNEVVEREGVKNRPWDPPLRFHIQPFPHKFDLYMFLYQNHITNWVKIYAREGSLGKIDNQPLFGQKSVLNLLQKRLNRISWPNICMEIDLSIHL